MQNIRQQAFCGRKFTNEDISLIQDIIATCGGGGISRRELAHTVCELLEWKRPNGKLKARECIEFLELLDAGGALKLPEKRKSQRISHKIISETPCRQPSLLNGSVEDFVPLEVQQVKNKEQRDLFKNLLGKHHYLGYAMPFGARLQYLVYVNKPHREVVGCVQFSSPAWRMRARDEWIGWTEERRKIALQQIVNNSRFLVLAPIKNLASVMLSCTLRELKKDWERQYGLEPLLVETLVDRQRFHGGCYRASNWIELGETTGRGRSDKTNTPNKALAKTILVYPLVKNAIHLLKEGGA